MVKLFKLHVEKKHTLLLDESGDVYSFGTNKRGVLGTKAKLMRYNMSQQRFKIYLKLKRFRLAVISTLH